MLQGFHLLSHLELILLGFGELCFKPGNFSGSILPKYIGHRIGNARGDNDVRHLV
jgi:hypothetical protein